MHKAEKGRRVEKYRKELIAKHGKFVRLEIFFLCLLPFWVLTYVGLSTLFSGYYNSWIIIGAGIIVLAFVVTIAIHCIIIPPSTHKELRAEAKELARADSTPVSAELVDTNIVMGRSAVGATARGLLGGVLFGSVGAAVGIVTAKKKIKEQSAIFLVEYESGRTDTEMVEIGSERFNKLMALTHK